MQLDRTGWIVVVTCALLLVWWMFFLAPQAQPPQPTPASPSTVTDTEDPDRKTEAGSVVESGEESDPEQDVPEEIVELRSDDEDGKGVLFRFSNKGGGVLTADLLEHTVELRGEENVRINAGEHLPIGSLVTGASGPEGRDGLTYRVEKQTDSEIIYAVTRPDGIKVTKRYYLNKSKEGDKNHKSESHLLHCEVTLENPAGEGRQAVYLNNYWFYGGSIAPFSPQPMSMMYTGFYYKARSFTYRPIGYLNKFALLMRPERETYTHTPKGERGVNWGGASNQFFAIVIRDPDKKSSAFWTKKYPVTIEGKEKESARARLKGLECALALPNEMLNPGDAPVTVKYDIYLGPKEYQRVAQLEDSQKDLMAYGKIPVMGPMFGWMIKPVSEILVWVMVKLHGLVGNFGVAILLLTIIVRLIIWPVHAKAHRVGKQMAQLTPKIQELKDKYPDDPQKLQQEQMKLWTDYGINPMGGCLPAFIQLPIFLGYFRMLSSAAELRHEGFLWFGDLSMPDTVFYIAGFPINLLPILMTVTSYLQFSMMPKTGDKNQQLIFKFMPLMFLVFCYNYASALALYWTWQNIISMGQTYVLNKRDIPKLIKKKRPKGKKGFMERLQEQAEAARQAQQDQRSGSGGAKKKAPSAPGFGSLATATGQKGGGSNTGSTNFGERGPRKQKPKGKGKRKKRR